MNSRVRELVKKIENHPHRHSLQRDLQQNKAYNPFSTTTKKMLQDVGNVELFELFKTDPKTQCKECLSYWSEGIVYCTCGHLLKGIEANRGVIEFSLDLLDEDVCLKWDDLAEQDFTYRMTESEYFSIQTKLVNLSQ